MYTLPRRDYMAASGAMLAGLFAGCIGENPFERDEAEGWMLRFGMLAPESGPFERFGQDMIESVELLERQVEAADLGFALEYTTFDTESDPDVAVAGAEELLDDGYEVLLGPCLDEAVIEVMKAVTADAQVPIISPVAAAGMRDFRRLTIDGEETHLVFSTAPDAHHIGRAFNRTAALSGAQAVGIVHGDGAYGTRMRDEAVDEFNLRGISVEVELAVDEEADAADLDIRDILTELHDSDADLIVMATNPGQGQELLREYYANFDPKPTVLSDRLRDPELPSIVGASLEEAIAVGINPIHSRRGIGAVPQELEEEEDPDDLDLEVEVDDEVVDINPHRPIYEVFPDLFGRRPTSQTMQTFDAAVILVLSIVSAREGFYEGPRIAQAVERVASAPDGPVQYQANYGFHNYWEGLGEIGAGTVNNYLGHTGDVSFHPSRGTRQRPMLNAVMWDDAAPDGFAELFPIPLQFG